MIKLKIATINKIKINSQTSNNRRQHNCRRRRNVFKLQLIKQT